MWVNLRKGFYSDIQGETMHWPGWVENNKWQWFIGTIIAIIGIIIPVVLHILNSRKFVLGPTKKIDMVKKVVKVML